MRIAAASLVFSFLLSQQMLACPSTTAGEIQKVDAICLSSERTGTRGYRYVLLFSSFRTLMQEGETYSGEKEVCAIVLQTDREYSAQEMRLNVNNFNGTMEFWRKSFMRATPMVVASHDNGLVFLEGQSGRDRLRVQMDLKQPDRIQVNFGLQLIEATFTCEPM